jgi:hypothetical protein
MVPFWHLGTWYQVDGHVIEKWVTRWGDLLRKREEALGICGLLW